MITLDDGERKRPVNGAAGFPMLFVVSYCLGRRKRGVSGTLLNGYSPPVVLEVESQPMQFTRGDTVTERMSKAKVCVDTAVDIRTCSTRLAS